MILNNMQLAALLGKNCHEIDSWKAILPKWAALIGVAGRELLPQKRGETRSKDLRRLAQNCGLEFLPALSKLSGEIAKEAIIEPSLEPWKDTYKGSSQDIFFVTTLDKANGFVLEMNRVANEVGYPTGDIGIYIQPRHVGKSSAEQGCSILWRAEKGQTNF